MDLNNNGRLEKDEVRKFTEKTMKIVTPDKTEFDEKEFEENFAKLDKDADGSVSPDELLASLVAKAEASGVLAEGQ